MRHVFLCFALTLGFTVGMAIQTADVINPSRQAASVQGEIGPRVEPDGRSAAATGGEIGPCVEPDGRSAAATGGDGGPCIEPDGRSERRPIGTSTQAESIQTSLTVRPTEGGPAIEPDGTART